MYVVHAQGNEWVFTTGFSWFCVVWLQGVVLWLLSGWWSTGEAEEFRNHNLHRDWVQLLAFPHQLPACRVSLWHPQDWSVTVLVCFHLYLHKVLALSAFLVAFIFEWKNLNLLDLQEQCIHKLGQIQSELKLLFDVYYWFLKLSPGILWHSYFPSHEIL